MTVYRFDRRQLMLRYGIGLVAAGIWAATGDAFGIAMLVLVLVVTAWTLRRPRLLVSDRGITAANLFATRRIKWLDITGFGYGEYRRAWCAQVKLADGSSVPLEVLSDKVGSGGNPSERVSAIVADLRSRLEAHTGIQSPVQKAASADDGTTVDLEPLAGFEVRARRAYRQLKWVSACGAILALFFIGLGINSIVGATTRPHTYARLHRQGVHLNAVFDGCGHIDRFDKNPQDDVCTLTVTYAGTTRRWHYQDDYPQFNNVAVGSRIPVLLDPNHPTTVYTVHDVDSHTNAGAFSVIGLFGFGAILAGVGLLLWLGRFARSARNMRRDSLQSDAELARVTGAFSDTPA